jgi:hypothetical protein
VILPAVRARIKQPRERARPQIARSDIGTFEAIAPEAGVGEIVEAGRAAVLFPMT